MEVTFSAKVMGPISPFTRSRRTEEPGGLRGIDDLPTDLPSILAYHGASVLLVVSLY